MLAILMLVLNASDADKAVVEHCGRIGIRGPNWRAACLEAMGTLSCQR